MARRCYRYRAFVGQPQAAKPAKTAVRGAEVRGVRVGHILLSGPPGTGKNLLAKTVAEDFGSNMFSLNAGDPKNVRLRAFLECGQPGDFLFVDEAHRLTRRQQDMLRFHIDGDCATTMILATNNVGDISYDIQTRMSHHWQLRPYNQKELAEIISEFLPSVGMLLKPQAVTAIAKASHGIPRTAKNRLENLQAFVALRKNVPEFVTMPLVRSFLRNQGIDPIGLDFTDHAVLKLLHEKGPLSRRTIVNLLQNDATTIEGSATRLFHHHLIRFVPRSYEITAAGSDWVQCGFGSLRKMVTR